MSSETKLTMLEMAYCFYFLTWFENNSVSVLTIKLVFTKSFDLFTNVKLGVTVPNMGSHLNIRLTSFTTEHTGKRMVLN